MKTYQRIIILALTVLFVFAAACKPAEPAATEPPTTDALVATAEPTAEPTVEPTVEPTTEPKEFQRGVWTDNVYENEYLNLRFTMPEGLVSATDAEMATMMELGEDVLENDNLNELQKQIAAMKTIYDMMVSNQQTGSNVLVVLENLKLSVGGDSLTPEAYAEILASQIAGSQVSGYAYTAQEGYTAELGGESYYVLPAVLGDRLMNQDFYLRRVDGYMLSICISYAGGNEAEAASIMNAFTAIDA